MHPITGRCLLQFLLLFTVLSTATAMLTIRNNSTHTFPTTITPDELSLAGFGSNHIGPLSGTVKCETTSGSPHITDIKKAINRLKALPADARCEQGNGLGSRCTQMTDAGDAALGICGKSLHWIPCSKAVEAATRVVTLCAWNGLAGGTAWFDWDTVVWIIVYKS